MGGLLSKAALPFPGLILSFLFFLNTQNNISSPARARVAPSRAHLSREGSRAMAEPNVPLDFCAVGVKTQLQVRILGQLSLDWVMEEMWKERCFLCLWNVTHTFPPFEGSAQLWHVFSTLIPWFCPGI